MASAIQPGRVITPPDDESEAGRREMAAKIGFDAYGVTDHMPDPTARAIHGLLDHLNAVDKKLEGMCEALRGLGSDYCDQALPELREEDFRGMDVDKNQ